MDGDSSYINKLPTEMLLKIFSYLSVEDLGVNIQFVCKKWSHLCLYDVLWKYNSFCPQCSLPLSYILGVLEKLPKLRRFSMHCVTPEILDKLADCCKDLRSLRFIDVKAEECVKAFGHLVSQCPNLEQLTIPSSLLAIEKVSEKVGKWTELHTICLVGTYSEPIKLKYIADGCPALQTLDMGDVEWAWEDLEYFIERKQQLSHLGIIPTNSQDLCAIALLSRCGSKLRELELNGSICGYRTPTFEAVRTLTSLTSLSLLSTFELRPDILANAFIDRGMCQLSELSIALSDVVDDSFVDVICDNCRNLSTLSLHGCDGITDAGCQHLYKCASLANLVLSECTCLTDKALQHIVKCTTLKNLDISQCKLIKESFELLLDLSQLVSLDVDGCDVAKLPVDLFPLHLKKLKVLTIGPNHGIGEERLSNLRAKIPNLKLIIQ